ncbi:MAG: DMT family transporter [Chloroflexota bacterium]|nr:DMT family transporter [Chloroflexota bacterium]
MAALLALVATILTSFLPILNKHILRDARPALVAWVINAASLPILAAGTLLLTQCSITSLRGGIPFSCTTHIPQIDGIFIVALLASVVLNWAATLLSTYALEKADVSLVSPLLTFNPAFTLLIAWLALSETPGFRQSVGVAIVLFGAYLLEVEEARTGLFAPLRVLLRRPGTLLAVGASALWGSTTVLEKLSIEHMTPPSGPAVALLGTLLVVVLLTPGALKFSDRKEQQSPQTRWQGLSTHPWALALAILIAGIAPLFGFTAIALGLVGYVTTLFKLSSVLIILWARVFLGEGQLRSRLLGASVMLVGGLLVVA